MAWYYSENDKQAGPVDEATFNSLVISGKVTPNTLVWREGMPDWIPYSSIAAGAAGQIAGGRCAECGNVFPPEDLISIENVTVCAGCKPLALQKIKEGVGYSAGYRFGGFWIRVLAKILDGLIFGVVQAILSFCMALVLKFADNILFEMLPGLLSLALWLSYSIWFVGKYGATPGKMICGLKIIHPNGEPVSYALATGRFFAEILSGLILYIGYIMIGFDDEKRALHDRICDTRVIYK